MAANGAALGAPEAVAAKLLDFAQPLDVGLLDSTVNAFYGAGSNQERMAAEAVLKAVQEHPEAWTRVDAILEHSKNPQTKFFGLQVLESVVRTRWGALPDAQREGIKTYCSNLIIKIATDEKAFRAERTFLSKLNLVLVDILKQDWPHKWPTFIPDIVGASKTNETLCENSMAILRLLSEEVFDFSKDSLTAAKTKELKSSFNEQFSAVHELCLMVLNASQKPDLIRATLATLNAFLSWVPLGYIFESNVIEVLLRLFPQPAFRNISLQCLAEIAALQVGPEYNAHFANLYKFFVAQLAALMPQGTNIPDAYSRGSDEDQAFVQNLAIFLAAFFRAHLGVLEGADELRAALVQGLDMLVAISYVDDDEVFKICLEYWNFFVPDVYSSVCTVEPSATAVAPSFSFGGAAAAAPGGGGVARRQLYQKTLTQLRALMIARMAKPEEVIVVEDENGNVVRETMKDTDVLARYKTMHETLVYLSHLDHDDTEQQMLEKLRLQAQLNGRELGWAPLNRLCWAIGSISGSMVEEQENRFLVTVIRDLLNLCEVTRGKDNKAVIASNIMYVVGQYPRFLRNHWKFLKTVVNKLFEFMHETHPGVQDMACETFLKIVSKCKRKFVIMQVGESEPFISELLTGLTATIQDLEAHQIHMFYEAVGLMVSADTDAKRRDEYLQRLMGPPNATWQQIIEQAKQNVEVLKQAEVIRNVQNILQTNVSVCSSLGHPFVSQFNLIFLDMLAVYKMYSELISAAIATGGPHASKTTAVKLMRSVKKVTLRLIETLVDKSEDADLVAAQYVPAMMDPILGDYARNNPDARDAEVLSMFAMIINRLRGKMEAEVPRIFGAVFECTLQMITRNFEDYPEHRLQFFSLLRAITNHCSATLFAMSPAQLKLVVDSIVWAFRHTERNIADTGLNLLHELLVMLVGSGMATQFHQAFYTQLVQEIFAVMTDTFHKPGFKLQARILHHLFSIVQNTEVVKAPLWDVAAQGPTAFPTNTAYVQSYVTNLLTTSFPNLRPQQVQATVLGMFEIKEFAAFKQHLRDFLVQTNQFADQNNADLFSEEVAAQAEAQRQKLANCGEDGKCSCPWGRLGDACEIDFLAPCRQSPSSPASCDPGVAKSCECFRRCREYGCVASAQTGKTMCHEASFQQQPDRPCYERARAQFGEQWSLVPEAGERGVRCLSRFLEGAQPVECSEALAYQPASSVLNVSLPLSQCPGGCSQRGWCSRFKDDPEEYASCTCAEGYTGESCEVEDNLCLLGCSGHGKYELSTQLAYDSLQRDEGGQRNPNHLAYHRFLERLLTSAVRTEDPSEASLFHIPAFNFAHSGNVGSGMDHLLLVLDHVRATRPHWNATGGRDHFFWAPADRGACELTGRQGSEVLHAPIKIVHWGHHTTSPEAAGPFGHVGHSATGPLSVEELAAGKKRLFFFAGGITEGDLSYSGGTRQALEALARGWQDPDFNFTVGYVGDQYEASLRSSRFCLAPYGYGYAMRVVEAMLAGCMPLIVQEHVFLPYEDLLPYETFSLRLTNDDLAQLRDILRGVTDQQYRQLLEGVVRNAPAFNWAAGGGAGGGGDSGSSRAFDYTVAALRRRHMQLKALYANSCLQVVGALDTLTADGHRAAHSDMQQVMQRLARAVLHFQNRFLSSAASPTGLLAQAWMPTVIEDSQIVLKTKNMPFAVAGMGDLLALFRCISCRFAFGTDVSKPATLGAPGRVYTSSEPEMCCNVQQYAEGAYLRKAEAEQCQVQSTLLLPLFISPRRSGCVGVLEVVQTSEDMAFADVAALLAAALEKSELFTCPLESVKRHAPHAARNTSIMLPPQTGVLVPPDTESGPSSGGGGGGGDTAMAGGGDGGGTRAAPADSDEFSADEDDDDDEDGEPRRRGKGDGGSRRRKGSGNPGKPGVRLTMADLQSQFGVGLKEAASRLGICPTTLKRACRRHGIQRWPRRQLQKVNRALDELEARQVLQTQQHLAPPAPAGMDAYGGGDPAADNRWTTLAHFVPAYHNNAAGGAGAGADGSGYLAGLYQGQEAGGGMMELAGMVVGGYGGTAQLAQQHAAAMQQQQQQQMLHQHLLHQQTLAAAAAAAAAGSEQRPAASNAVSLPDGALAMGGATGEMMMAEVTTVSGVSTLGQPPPQSGAAAAMHHAAMQAGAQPAATTAGSGLHREVSGGSSGGAPRASEYLQRVAAASNYLSPFLPRGQQQQQQQAAMSGAGPPIIRLPDGGLAAGGATATRNLSAISVPSLQAALLPPMAMGALGPGMTGMGGGGMGGGGMRTNGGTSISSPTGRDDDQVGFMDSSVLELLLNEEHRNGGMQQHHHHQGATSGAGGPSASNPQSTTAGDLLLPVGAMSQLPAMSNGGLSGLSFML
ncbi:exportin-1-like isoform X2 [Micractinium conductrix]|uniref:Exportin-1-like isoform X2 n=1 Tax=Micractinium conductrix TaxID=554055 RepID=A0A2P6VCB2_9CHLO|nr:exportin-1-like isoform X2 [Micractinium conductrix]|eukprot:PSC71723.1 exportin-1-like isoform X2 [Micractinium conductrix]